ncbi:MAG: histidine kinase [Nostoc sp.]|uniref:histidine kinase n=1 Tax=Nostoc sp. TaxID=1180 RepID=UPI002FFA2B2E
MGSGEWGVGDEGAGGAGGEELITNAQCPMPNAPCPMPNAQCPMPNPHFPTSNPEY